MIVSRLAGFSPCRATNENERRGENLCEIDADYGERNSEEAKVETIQFLSMKEFMRDREGSSTRGKSDCLADGTSAPLTSLALRHKYQLCPSIRVRPLAVLHSSRRLNPSAPVEAEEILAERLQKTSSQDRAGDVPWHGMSIDF